MWGKSEEFGPLLRRNWRRDLQGYPMYTLTRNLKSLKHALKDLNKRYFSDIEARAATQEHKVKVLQEDIGRDPTRERIEEEYEALQELKKVTEARDEYMAQKLKGKWVLEGDANTTYFHAILKGRRDQNKVRLLEDMDGVICDNPQAIKTAFLNYYQNILGQSHSTSKVHKKIINYGPRCNAEMVQLLLQLVTGEEVKATLLSIPDTKSPGPDGYTSRFFKDAWTEIGSDVIAAVKDFFTHKRLLRQVNATILTLIPKTERPTSVQQFRPIACCNTIYKIISKMLCNRLATALPLLVDQNQGAFIKGRNIQENILICQDLIRLYERPSTSPRFLIKMDLQNSYDTVEWCFIDQLLQHLHFPDEFR
ncbi:hypothetical protein vseg_011694 [Gypsophila vaccaria]